jgi:hypothetical protein
MSLDLAPGSLANPALPRAHEGLAPSHQSALHSAINLPANLALDLTLRHVSKLPALD